MNLYLIRQHNKIQTFEKFSYPYEPSVILSAGVYNFWHFRTTPAALRGGWGMYRGPQFDAYCYFSIIQPCNTIFSNSTPCSESPGFISLSEAVSSDWYYRWFPSVLYPKVATKDYFTSLYRMAQVSPNNSGNITNMGVKWLLRQPVHAIPITWYALMIASFNKHVV